MLLSNKIVFNCQLTIYFSQKRFIEYSGYLISKVAIILDLSTIFIFIFLCDTVEIKISFNIVI